jgi:hypothetical protein
MDTPCLDIGIAGGRGRERKPGYRVGLLANEPLLLVI